MVHTATSLTTLEHSMKLREPCRNQDIQTAPFQIIQKSPQEATNGVIMQQRTMKNVAILQKETIKA